jgi:hypothetical protein
MPFLIRTASKNMMAANNKCIACRRMRPLPILRYHSNFFPEGL